MNRTIDLARGAGRMWFRNYSVFRKLFVKSMAPTLFEPFLYLFSLGLGLGFYVHEIQGLSYIQFIAPGFIASTAMFAASYECTYNSFIRLRYERVYDAILATPLEPGDIVLGEMLWGATRSLISSTVFLGVIAALGLTKSWLAMGILPVVFLAAFLFGIYGMIFTALIPDITLYNYYFTLIITPLFLFSGIFYPIESLPSWAQVVAQITPLYHFVEICRSLVVGLPTSALVIHLSYLVISVLILMPLPLWLMKRRMIH